MYWHVLIILGVQNPGMSILKIYPIAEGQIRYGSKADIKKITLIVFEAVCMF